jgi:hypothetical protein
MSQSNSFNVTTEWAVGDQILHVCHDLGTLEPCFHHVPASALIHQNRRQAIYPINPAGLFSCALVTNKINESSDIFGNTVYKVFEIGGFL